MAGIDDLVTVQKNGVVAVNLLVQALSDFRDIYQSLIGTLSSTGLDEDELITRNSGRLVNVSVIAAAAGGTIHDAPSVSAASNDNAIFIIPNQTGIISVNFPFSDGLVVKPASSSIVSISYSED
jgi:hypothetical protein